jgi:uncharacterized protein
MGSLFTPKRRVGWDAFHLAEVLLTQPLMVVGGDTVASFGAYCDSCEIYGCQVGCIEQEGTRDQDWAHYHDLDDKPEPVSLRWQS